MSGVKESEKNQLIDIFHKYGKRNNLSSHGTAPIGCKKEELKFKPIKFDVRVHIMDL
jgi:hypothetical protein